MKKLRNASQLKKHHKRQLKRVLDRRKNDVIYVSKWLPQSPLIPESNRLPPKKDWEDYASHLYPPNDFRLFANPAPVINFFNQVESNHRRGKDVYLHLENVSSLTSDTMLLMVARTVDERFNNRRRVGGFLPLDPKSKTVFEESGVFGDKRFNLSDVRNTKGSIQRHKDFQVSPETVDYLIKYAADYFVSREQSTGNYDTLIELMNNTNMHAGGGFVDSEVWWCSVYLMSDKVLFNFLDNGKGICETSIKRLGRKIFEFLGFRNNSDLLEDILNDKVLSRTGKYYHGRGLPLIRRRAQNKLIENVIIITNDVFANVSTGEYKLMNSYFRGTFVHWEISLKKKTIIVPFKDI